MQVKALQEGRIKLFWRCGFPEEDKKQFIVLRVPSVLFPLFAEQHYYENRG